MAISKLTDTLVNARADTVYTYKGFNLQELLNEFFQKINDCIDVSNKALKFLEWLVETGLPLEVKKELQNMYEDGRLTQLIDEMAGNLTQQINDLSTKTENRFDDLENTFLPSMDVNGGEWV